MPQSIEKIERIAVIGTGQMGRGIAQVAAQSGLQVSLWDVSPKNLEAGHDFIAKQLQRGVDRGHWPKAHQQKVMANIAPVQKIESLQRCHFAIEAASEDKQVKFEVFRQLDQVLPPDAILTSNTSSLSIAEIASVTGRPSQVAGMHFMNPVPVMKLVEVIRSSQTSQETFTTVKETAQQMDKVVIIAKDMPGFAVNRILMPMINEACFALQDELATIDDIDQAMKLGCHLPMGPLELADFIGLDTVLAIIKVLHDGFRDDKYRPCPLLEQYVSAGHLGRKTGQGFYQYGSTK